MILLNRGYYKNNELHGVIDIKIETTIQSNTHYGPPKPQYKPAKPSLDRVFL